MGNVLGRLTVLIVHYYDSVNMIRHYDKGIQSNIRAQLRCSLPFLNDYPANGVWHHPIIVNCSEQLGAAIRADRNKVDSVLTIIVALQSRRPSCLHLKLRAFRRNAPTESEGMKRPCSDRSDRSPPPGKGEGTSRDRRYMRVHSAIFQSSESQAFMSTPETELWKADTLPR